MKVSYDREQDILMVEVSGEPIDYAEEFGPIIVHFTKDEKPVLLEVLDASELLTEATKVTMTSRDETLTEVSV
ncbi:MAG: DUF2283 domain-containing protein [Euryarchaeota archaeon]|nr:DUF2283 domain-containing protein [Euryarchaeota archaeon]